MRCITHVQYATWQSLTTDPQTTIIITISLFCASIKMGMGIHQILVQYTNTVDTKTAEYFEVKISAGEGHYNKLTVYCMITFSAFPFLPLSDLSILPAVLQSDKDIQANMALNFILTCTNERMRYM